jgi:predicted transglutaminase-like cysteine proteinase
VLRDLNLKLAHAVLVVELNGRKYVLDNQIAATVPAEMIRHYQPIYSVNETHWWLHRRL